MLAAVVVGSRMVLGLSRNSKTPEEHRRQPQQIHTFWKINSSCRRLRNLETMMPGRATRFSRTSCHLSKCRYRIINNNSKILEISSAALRYHKTINSCQSQFRRWVWANLLRGLRSRGWIQRCFIIHRRCRIILSKTWISASHSTSTLVISIIRVRKLTTKTPYYLHNSTWMSMTQRKRIIWTASHQQTSMSIFCRWISRTLNPSTTS